MQTDTKPIATIDLTRDLSKVRGMTGSHKACSYSAPCAIGAMLTPEQRQELVRLGKDTVPIRDLVSEGLIDVPEGQINDVCDLQNTFDSSELFGGFDDLLAEMSAKYLGKAA